MKLKNVIFMIFLTIFMFAFNSVDAESTAPASYNVNFNDFHLLYGSNYLPKGELKFYYKKNVNGKIIYCYDQKLDSPTGSATVYKLDSELSSKYAYILENGYPNKSLTGNNDKDYYITGMAIWYLVNPDNDIFRNFDINNGTFLGQANDIAKYMGILVNGANKASYVNPTISINNSNNSMSLSSDGKYYVSNKISVTAKGNISKYTVSLENAPKGTVITDVNGNVKNTFSVNESFLVKVVASNIKDMKTNFSIKVSATGSVNKAYLYKTSNSNVQRTIALYPENKSVSANTTLNINVNTRVEISKVDATSGNELSGAKLVVKDSKGEIIDSWTSTTEAHVIEGIEPGEYTLTEEIAPDGYSLSTETVTFTVKVDGSVTKVKMENKLNTVYISKKDSTTGEELPGAKLILKDQDGKVVDTWVSEDTPHMIEGLKAGKYTLTEEIAPDGYDLSTETVTFTVNADGTVDSKVIMYNKPTVVDVPSTGSNKTITTSLIGLLIIGLGSLVIYKNSNKKNEEI